MTDKPSMVNLTIDGKAVSVPEGVTIWQAAREAGVEIPVLCHDPRYEAVGVCRMCVVDVGERVLAASCVRPCAEGMVVRTATEEIMGHRKTLTALLLSDYPQHSARAEAMGNDALINLAGELGITQVPYADGSVGNPRGADDSSPAIAVDHQACILCDRCIRACDDLQHNDVIGRTGKGYTARIAFDLNQPMGQSSCVACGECMAACPTGALTNKSLAGLRLSEGD